MTHASVSGLAASISIEKVPRAAFFAVFDRHCLAGGAIEGLRGPEMCQSEFLFMDQLIITHVSRAMKSVFARRCCLSAPIPPSNCCTPCRPSRGEGTKNSSSSPHGVSLMLDIQETLNGAYIEAAPRLVSTKSSAQKTDLDGVEEEGLRMLAEPSLPT